MQPIEWLSERDFRVGGVTFHCSLDDYSAKTTEDRIVILKSRGALENYQRVFEGESLHSILEFGVFQGGSPILFSLWLEVDKFVGIDHSPPVAGFDAFCRRHPVGARIRTYYGVSQTDQPRVDEIVRREFAGAPPDVVIDDASHGYGNSRRTFEIAFPHLKPGGTYVLEDWGWAHWRNCSLFRGETALSLLVFELIMICASRPDLISEVRVFSSFVFVKKALSAPDLTGMKLEDYYQSRGFEISTVDRLNATGVVSNFVAKARKRAGRILRR
jgi:SAM-dependent methyltransferase